MLPVNLSVGLEFWDDIANVPARYPHMTRREFQLIDGTSRKFWAIQLDGKSFTVHYGRIGTAGQAQEKSFADDAAAQAAADKLILEKTKKGYSEVEGSATGAAGPVPPVRASPETQPKPPAAAAKNEETPKPESAAAATTPSSTAAGELQRSIALKEDDYVVATWREHHARSKSTPTPFDLGACLEQLKSLGSARSYWQQDWASIRVPEFPTREEAHFWILAHLRCQAEKASPDDTATYLAGIHLDGNLPTKDVIQCFVSAWRLPTNFFACIAALVPLDEFVNSNWNSRHGVGAQFSSLFRQYVLPYVSVEERQRLIGRLAGRIVPTIPASYYDAWPSYYYAGALLGCSDQIGAVLRGLPDDYYKTDTHGFHHDHYQSPQWLAFGLADAETVASETRRLGFKLRTREEGRSWLALTGLSALDVIAYSASAAKSKEDAAKPAGVLALVSAPEAALPALQIATASKAPHVGQEWLNRNPLHAVVGLVPTAMSTGKLADAACEFLRMLRRGEMASSLTAALPHLPESEASWLQAEIIDSAEESIAEASREELPGALRVAFGNVKPAKPPGWLTLAALPPFKIQGKKLAVPEVEGVLAELKVTPVGTASPLLAALRELAEPRALDSFAWRVFALWLSMGAPSKDKWAMGAIGHLGGDESVLKLTPLVRDWPGESQHQRAVFGLECLRAVGTDTALMALNGIAQKLKFKGLKEKAQALMESIAETRGLTREQLADRIVPDCGLDEQGGRVFDFGPRQFRFVLGSEMKPLVRDASGKTKPDLPAPNNSDNREQAETAVAEWKLLKKTLREVLKVQAQRLEDAMITGRRWTPTEFQTLLVQHPLMVNLVRQLVFGVYDESGVARQTFRVTEDQTLADQNDDACELPTAGQVGVVHPAQLDETTKGAWGQVLSDYEIIPPFQQLGRAICRPEAADLDETTITRFRGPQIPGIVVYGMLEKSQWLRDSPADGGGFMQHSKHFPSANLTAFIQYTGLSIGYYDQEQELEAIYFVPGHVKPEWWGDHKNRVKIRAVDPVVMSEVLRLANAIVSKAP